MASDKIRFRKAANEANRAAYAPFEFPVKDDRKPLDRKKTDYPAEDYVDDLFSSEDHQKPSSFESVFVIEFLPGVKKKAVHWLVDKIRGKKAHGGAELLVMREPLTR